MRTHVSLSLKPTQYPTTVDLLPAADVVMSGFSTTNYFAILLGLRDVVYAGTAPDEKGGEREREREGEEQAVTADGKLTVRGESGGDERRERRR